MHPLFLGTTPCPSSSAAVWLLLGLVACGEGGPDDAFARLWINEFMASNHAAVPDVDGAYPDWLELYNEEDVDVDLDGFTITDDLGEPEKHPLADGLVVPAGGFLVLWADRDPEQGDDHLVFKLAAAGEEIGLYGPDGFAVDEVEYGEQYVDWSAIRLPDGGEQWTFTDLATPGAVNEAP